MPLILPIKSVAELIVEHGRRIVWYMKNNLRWEGGEQEESDGHWREAVLKGSTRRIWRGNGGTKVADQVLR